MGFDSGGTEQLWEPDVLMDMLKSAKKNEPFSRADPQSQFLRDLEALHPNITWRNSDLKGGFRSIFRKSNPLVKLGLTTSETNNAVVTELGDNVIFNGMNISEVYALAAKSHKDQDGNRSMAQMCLAGLEAPEEIFSESDIELGISVRYISGSGNLKKILSTIRKQQLVITSKTRHRRIRSFMNGLVYAEAFSETESGWSLRNKKVAQAISSNIRAPIALTANEPNTASQKVKKKNNTFSPAVTTGRGVAAFDLTSIIYADPQQTALALERSNQIHEDIVGVVGKLLKELKLEAFEDPKSFDLAVFKQSPSLYEIKSITSKNIISQLRKAIVQLEEYRWRHLDLFQSPPALFIVLNSDPTPWVEEAFLDFVQKDRGIQIIWLSDVLLDLNGSPLQDILIHQ